MKLLAFDVFVIQVALSNLRVSAGQFPSDFNGTKITVFVTFFLAFMIFSTVDLFATTHFLAKVLFVLRVLLDVA